MGSLLNGLLESLIGRWLMSDEAKRYITAAVLRGGTLLMGSLLLRWGAKYGIEDGAQAVIAGHWQAILELLAPAAGAVVIELASKARANLTTKTIEVAAQAPARSLTPAMAVETAKVAIQQEKDDKKLGLPPAEP